MHHGQKLKKLVEKSGIKIKELLAKSELSRGSLYNYFDSQELSPKQIRAILNVLQVSENEFFEKQFVSENYTSYSLKERVKDLEEQIEILKNQLKDKDKIIELLQSGKQKPVAAKSEKTRLSNKRKK